MTTISENKKAQSDPNSKDKARDIAASNYAKQSEVVRELRSKTDCNSEELLAAETRLKELKREFDAAKKAVAAEMEPEPDIFDRKGTEDLLKRRFFIAPSFEIYGGVAGLYDYGPPGCSVKNNVIAEWRQHFICEEAMLELEASCLTPEIVLKASGHVDKFTDLMVKDSQTGACYRADHLLKDHINGLIDNNAELIDEERRNTLIALRERLDELTAEEMDAALAQYEAKAPETGNALTQAYPFNLMFQTSIGPSGLMPGYLRPETAQGIFINFRRLLEYMGGKLPFACAQIGLSFRNEISPKAGLLRVREFVQAEIEHFVSPHDKSHPKFSTVRDINLNLYGRHQQVTPPFQTVQMSIGDAVEQGIVANETLGYFIARTSQFAEQIGLSMEHVRFRQHLQHEMAHYAQDCWDLEVNSSYGWVECAGLADRAAYDLSNHSKKSGSELTAREVFAEVQHVTELVCVPSKGIIGRTFRGDAKRILAALAEMSENELQELKSQLEVTGRVAVGGFELTADHLTFKSETKAVTGRSFYPSVIEPSFGIGRLLACLWEHSYYVRPGTEEDAGAVRAVLALKPAMAPVKCAVLPLSKNDMFNPTLQRLGIALGRAGLIYRVDDSGQSIGRRYARSDEIGTPFGITVDFQSVEDGSVTVRERDSTLQIRCSADDAVRVIGDMVFGRASWADIANEFPAFNSSE